MTGSYPAALAIAAVLVATGCRPPAMTGTQPPQGRAESRAAARGAVLYDGYCAGCHGPDGRGDGPVAAVLNLRPADLRAPALREDANDEELVARLLDGTPLRTHPTPTGLVEERQAAALERYVLEISYHDAAAIRGGRLIYEQDCAACHGVYGQGMGKIMPERAMPDLADAQRRLPDDVMASVIRNGVGEMLPIDLGAAEMATLIAYLRVLSPGHRLYGTYCAGCHGDDGRGVHPEDLLPPAIAAPPLDSARLASMSPAKRRQRVLHMFRRERGLMPHFREILGPAELRDLLAYVRD